MQHPKQMRDRTFGLTLSSFLFVLALIGWALSAVVPVKLFVAAGCFLAFTLVAPGLLMPLNRIWIWFGLKLGRVINCLILGLFYFFVMLPIGFLMRLTGFDPMRKKRQTDGASYWTPVDRRANPETYPDTF
jgi:hypothetical protein